MLTVTHKDGEHACSAVPVHRAVPEERDEGAHATMPDSGMLILSPHTASSPYTQHAFPMIICGMCLTALCVCSQMWKK